MKWGWKRGLLFSIPDSPFNPHLHPGSTPTLAPSTPPPFSSLFPPSTPITPVFPPPTPSIPALPPPNPFLLVYPHSNPHPTPLFQPISSFLVPFQKRCSFSILFLSLPLNQNSNISFLLASKKNLSSRALMSTNHNVCFF